jgi:hypothetical protein
MDLRALGALLSALGGVFSAKAGASAGQLQGLLMGEELTERRKRMKMAEEAHQLQTELQRAREAREAELFPLQKALMEQERKEREELFPLKKEATITQVEMGKLNLSNTRLWTMYQQGITPSQISDPVLRAEYEPFFNFQRVARSLEFVRSREELDKLLESVSEEWRPTLEILGRAHLFRNQAQEEMVRRQLQGLEVNIATGDFQLRTLKLNYVMNTILNNINNEGTDWDKRTPQQKIEAVKKWIAQLGLSDVVPEDFANMFQRVKSSDARQLAIMQAQIEMQLQAQLAVGRQSFQHSRALQQEAMFGNIFFGAVQGQDTGVAPLGFSATKLPPVPAVFRNTPDNQGSYLNLSGLNNYFKAPLDITVRVPVGNQIVPTRLNELQAKAYAVYQNLGRLNATPSVNDINTIILYDAGLLQSFHAEQGFELDWNSAVLWASERILPILKAHPAFRTNQNFQKAVSDWERAFQQRLQQRQGQQGQQGQQRSGQSSSPPSRRGQGRQPSQPFTQGDIPRGRIGREQ